MLIGGSSALDYGAGLVGGSGTASGVVSANAASGSAATPRMRELMEGAAPVNAEEQAWLARVGEALEGYLSITQALIGEASRQAALGNDLYGRPLQGAEDHAFEQRVLELVNAERARNGIGGLTYNRQLDAAAESHNGVQATVEKMAHDGLGDGTSESRIRATGFTAAWGENVAAGQLTPEQVVAEWMASPGHRRNILDPEYRQLGVSYTTAASGRTYWAQEFGA